MDKTLILGIAAGAGVAIVIGGITYMVVSNKKDDEARNAAQNAAIARLSRIQRPAPYRGPVVSPVITPVVAVPVVGRPFSDPFYREMSGSSLWGSGPWAHRSPRMRPVPQHHR